MKTVVTFLLIAIVGIFNVWGQQTMNIHKKNGEILKVKVADIDYINYSNGNNDGSQAVIIRDSELGRTQGNAPSVSGTWQVNANGFKGEMVINQNGSGISGYIFGPNDKISGTIQSDGSIQFLRSKANQNFTGKVNSNRMSGTFTWSGKTSKWEASR